MNDSDGAKIADLLEQIRDTQAAQLALQKEQFELVRRQMERTERIQDRAEHLQERGAGIMKTARGTLYVVLPVVVLMILYVSWMIFSR